MAFDDLPLHRESPSAPASSRDRPSWIRWVIVGGGGVVAGVLLTLWWMSRAQPPTAIPAPTTAADAAQGLRRPQREPTELPTLAGSDAMFRDLVSQLSQNPQLARLLLTSSIVRAATLAVVQIGDGRTPASPLAVLRPSMRLQIGGGTSGKIPAANYARWDAATRALQSVAPADAAQLYVNVKPLFDEAYRELGYPDADFDQAIVKAVRMLNATPDAGADLVLLRREGYFEHDDASLRSLPPVQKQLLLTGPDNRHRILNWLHQLADALDLKIG